MIKDQVIELLSLWPVDGSVRIDEISKLTGVGRDEIKLEMLSHNIYADSDITEASEDEYKQRLTDCGEAIMNLIN